MRLLHNDYTMGSTQFPFRLMLILLAAIFWRAKKEVAQRTPNSRINTAAALRSGFSVRVFVAMAVRSAERVFVADASNKHRASLLLPSSARRYCAPRFQVLPFTFAADKAQIRLLLHFPISKSHCRIVRSALDQSCVVSIDARRNRQGSCGNLAPIHCCLASERSAAGSSVLQRAAATSERCGAAASIPS